MKVRELMSRPVVVVGPQTPTGEAAALLGKHQITAMPVLDADSLLVGIISEGDLLRNELARYAPAGSQYQARVGLLMSSPAAWVSDTDDISAVAELMLHSNVHSVPVLDSGEVIGIISRRDLVRTLVRSDDALAAEVRVSLDAYAGRAGRWDVEVRDGAVTITGEFDDHVEEQVVRALVRIIPGVLTVSLNPDAAHSS